MSLTPKPEYSGCPVRVREPLIQIRHSLCNHRGLFWILLSPPVPDPKIKAFSEHANPLPKTKPTQLTLVDAKEHKCVYKLPPD